MQGDFNSTALRRDLIEVFKWVKDFNKRDVEKVLTVSSQERTRSNGFKLEKCIFRKEIGRKGSKV